MYSPFAPGMIRDSSSVKFTWSLSFGPASGSFGGFPPAFLPVAASRSCRRFSFASYSACSAACRSCARSLIFSCASRIATSRSSRRCNSSGMSSSCCSCPPSSSARCASSSRVCTSPPNCCSSLFACPQLIALCLLAFPCTFVPSRLTRPIRSVPSAFASTRICLNNSCISDRNRLRKVAIVSWSGCSSPVM